MSSAEGTAVGCGERVAGEGRFGGTVARADAVEDVLALAQTDLSSTVLLTEQASATALGPILSMVAGVLCTRGGPSAHLAIVCRALQLPCVMQVELSGELGPGDTVSVDDEGRVWRR